MFYLHLNFILNTREFCFSDFVPFLVMAKKKKGRLLPVEKLVFNPRIGKVYRTTVYINPDKELKKDRLRSQLDEKKKPSLVPREVEIKKEIDRLMRTNEDFALTMKVSLCSI